MTEKRIEKGRWHRHSVAGSAYFNASDRLHFFQAGECGRDMSRDSEFVKNRPKTTRNTTSAGKTACILATILTCFAGGQTTELLAMGRPICGFHLLALPRLPNYDHRKGQSRAFFSL